ncbi:MAG: HslU--HslV peptidase ATPase subunit [Candidatus Marinimicrobia bacterium]|nr:HslU--HslV peptidase ATPase subunit [Candidatus Neomarinimicrobiota bacterium]
MGDQMTNLTPKKIVKELDKYIIGQTEAKKSVAIALRNRWRRQQTDAPMKDEIMPNNIILIGSTGVGKTEISRRLATLSGAPFVKVEASKFTEVGYVGRDVESMIRDLIEVVIKQIKSEKEAEVKGKAYEITQEKILDLLFPINDKIDEQKETVDRNDRTKDKMRKKLYNGDFEEKFITIEAKQNPLPMMQVMGPLGMDDLTNNIQDMISGLVPKKTKSQKIKVKDARDILIQEEAEKLIDMDEVIKDGLTRAENEGIIFIDEIDKIAGGSNGSGPDVSREGVQRDILPIIEGSTVSTKYGQVHTHHMLFIAAGAFHVSKPSDLIPELQGRFPIRQEMSNLTKKDFIKILTKPKNALIKQYQALMKSEDIKLSFDSGAINEISKIAYEINEKMENIGARRLHTVMSTLLEDLMFEAPTLKNKKINITKSFVKKTLDGIIGDEDLRRYIL